MSTYPEIGRDIGELVEKKQASYGDSFGKSSEVLRVLYPNGIGLEHLADALTVVRVVDKLFRIATDRDALGESPWRDIAGYSLLAVRSAEAPPTAESDNPSPAAGDGGKLLAELEALRVRVADLTERNGRLCGETAERLADLEVSAKAWEDTARQTQEELLDAREARDGASVELARLRRRIRELEDRAAGHERVEASVHTPAQASALASRGVLQAWEPWRVEPAAPAAPAPAQAACRPWEDDQT